jgi:hypothetical protein
VRSKDGQRDGVLISLDGDTAWNRIVVLFFFLIFLFFPKFWLRWCYSLVLFACLYAMHSDTLLDFVSRPVGPSEYPCSFALTLYASGFKFPMTLSHDSFDLYHGLLV